MDRTDFPSLDDLRAFEAVARLGSVRVAADSLALTHGAVSRRVSKLSAAIGVQLLTPQGRSIRLTPDGEKLALAAKDGFALITNALEEIRAGRTERPIVLSCERSVAMRWLIPRLSTFQDRFPDLKLHLSVGGGPLDFEKERVDLAIRRLDFPLPPDRAVEEMMVESVGPVMSPDKESSFNNGTYTALASRTRPDGWKQWLMKVPDAPKPKETLFLDHHFLMAEAAANGLGVAMCPKILAIDDIDRGRLVAPLGFREDGSKYGLIMPTHDRPPSIVSALRQWIIANIDQTNPTGV